jgi:hypothetical protein
MKTDYLKVIVQLLEAIKLSEDFRNEIFVLASNAMEQAYTVGAASRDAEIEKLKALIPPLTEEIADAFIEGAKLKEWGIGIK